MQLRVLGIILAGGKGTRLYPLTKERAKPAVPFGGKYRIVDFVLSNFINSGIHSIYVLTQFRSQSLLQHLNEGWQTGGLLKNQFIIPVPAQMRSGEVWYQGTADAIYQNINLIEQAEPHVVAIFGADHIYRMNIAHMIEAHQGANAVCTVAAIPVENKYAHEFGVIEVGTDYRILAFHEKNPDAPTIPGSPEHVFASMGNYLFSTRTLLKALHEDAADPKSAHDFGRNILPKLVVDQQAIYAYDYQTNKIPGEPADNPPYWRDVGTIEAYWEANMDLRSVKPCLNLYNRQWPLRTSSYPDPPAKFTFDDDDRRGEAIDSIVSGGCILSGGKVRNSVLGRGCRVHAGAQIEDSVILDNCDIGRRARIRRAILDKNVRVPPDSTIGYDLEQDQRLYHVTETGIVVVEGNRSPVDISSMVV
ncbi:MAG TPA: glucose-1-phosphate adenylyltransferase [Bryobacteraceae bacterium]|jgi:glucose-1-phosphate adenylyltransferase|nr:glucose-1-phosphate adenylyltransferase [Bryobacteraceae bacterium]